MTPQQPPAPADHGSTPPAEPGPADIRRWRRYLADERAEATVYQQLAGRRAGEEQHILLGLAEAEGRHEAHWRQLLGERAGRPRRPDLRTRMLVFLARHLGSVFVLALAQRAEARSPYATETHATATMAADERIHEEVVRGLATRGRNRLSGSFRAAVFGANDGLVSNLALILGVGASGMPNQTVLITGVAGLLAGALSMGAGEYVSVRSQRELLEASTADPAAEAAIPDLDIDANELALVYRARGMPAAEADAHAAEMLHTGQPATPTPHQVADPAADQHEAIGTGLRAGVSSFCFFASGAIIPVVPYLFGLTGLTAVIVAAGLVGIALLATGTAAGLLSGASPFRRGLRQLAIGYGAAAVTYLLGLLFGTTSI
jgi:VIT1/CCC1 family predicted Fe2+/Mn2+ transporter